jgi:uncharacterized protein YjeT (DUF2065 family)
MERTARGLGWFSLGIGLAEVAATKYISKAVRMPRRHNMLRMFGLRELATGVGLLSRKRRAPWVWARVAGDVMDLFALGSTFVKTKRRRGRIAAALAAVAGVTALDVFCGRRMSKAQ